MAEKPKKKNVMSMEDEDRAFFEAAMKDPEIRKQIEADQKRQDELMKSGSSKSNVYRDEAKRLIEKKRKSAGK